MATLAETATFLQLGCILITTAILIWDFRRRMKSRFRGATVWPILGVVPSLLFHRSHLYDWITRLLITNGGTFRLPGPWKCRVLTADPENIEYLLKTRYHNFGKGDLFKDTFCLMFGDSILAQDGESFKRLSVPIAKAFSSPAFRNDAAAALPAVMQNKLLPIFTDACEKSAVIDLQAVFHRLACYNIWLFGAGVDLDCLKPGLPTFPFIEAFGEATESLLFRLLMPQLCWKLMFERRLLKAKDFVYGFSIQHWCSRGRSPVADIASAFLEHERERGRLYSDKRKYELLVNLIFAGKDSITAGLTWFFWLVAKHPRVEEEILAELRKIKNPADQDPFCFSLEEVKRMEYLHSAVTESLRLYPPVPLESTVSAEDDVLPDGTPVEKGAQVLYSIYSSGRLESVWGEDCLEFKPERWMKNGSFVRHPDSKFLVFNGGPRRCTGMEFAYWQMKWAAASILIRYSIKIVDEHPVVPKYGLSLFMKHGMRAAIHQRQMAHVHDSSK